MASRPSSEGGDLHTEKASNPTVLVVDEDLKEMCEYCALLRDKGYQVRCTCSYTEGAACLQEEPVDFVIVSQGSRAFEGRRVVKRAIQQDRKTPVLVLTRFEDMGCYLEAMHLGASDYLRKPVSAEEILDQVTKHIGARM